MAEKRRADQQAKTAEHRSMLDEIAHTTHYCGFTVKVGERDRFVVVDPHGCNPIPGGMLSKTREGALNMIDCYVAAGGSAKDPFCESGVDVAKFHALIRISHYSGAE